jgi:hypothetical protein
VGANIGTEELAAPRYPSRTATDDGRRLDARHRPLSGRNSARGPSFRKTDLRTTSRLRPQRGTTVDLTFEQFNIFNNWNYERPVAATTQNWYSDQRLTDFLTLTPFTGGNGRPRAAQFSVRFGF